MRFRINSNQPGVRSQARVQAQLLPRGFALIEILIAGCILGIATVALYGAFSYGFALIRLSQEDVRADQILVQKLETLRLYDWSQTLNTSAGGIVPAAVTDSFAPGSASPGAVYNVTTTITDTPVSESYASTLRLVTVTVSWFSGKLTHTRSMSTLVSQNGLQTYKH